MNQEAKRTLRRKSEREMREQSGAGHREQDSKIRKESQLPLVGQPSSRWPRRLAKSHRRGNDTFQDVLRIMGKGGHWRRKDEQQEEEKEEEENEENEEGKIRESA